MASIRCLPISPACHAVPQAVTITRLTPLKISSEMLSAEKAARLLWIRGMIDVYKRQVLMNGITPAIVSDIKVENAVHAFKYAGVSDEDIVVAKDVYKRQDWKYPPLQEKWR